MRNIPSSALAVTPSDTANLEAESVIYVGGDGDVAILTSDGDTVTFAGLSAGDILPVACIRVMSTNTTATNLVAIW